jgi:hypothetical protein
VRAKAPGTGSARPNIWRQSGEIPGPTNNLGVVAAYRSNDARQHRKAKKLGFEPSEKQIAYAKRADRRLRKFSWEE